MSIQNVTIDSPDVGRFRDRRDAGFQLAWALRDYQGKRPLVLGIPRAGVVLADTVARELGGDLDVALVEKLRPPDASALAMGTIAENGLLFLNEGWEQVPTSSYLKSEAATALSRLRQRRRLYAPVGEPIRPAGRTVIIVDDGVATGATMTGALQSMQLAGARRVIAAVAVASRDSIAALRHEADEVVCVAATDSFYAISPFFLNYAAVSDDDVVELLREAARRPLRGQAG